MTREAWMWCGLAMAGLLWCGLSLAIGGGLLAPALLTGLCAVCGADAPARERVSRLLGKAFSGPAWRSVLIVAGALTLIQLLPLELALLMAGDVLVYVEALTAVSLIAANTRLRPVLAAARERLGPWLRSMVRPRPTPRTVRTTRPARRPAPTEDADGRGFAFA